MKVRIKISEAGGLRCNLLVLALDRKFKSNPSFVRLDKACKGKLIALAREERFRGGPGQLCLLSGSSGVEADRVLLLGLDRDHPGPAARWRGTAARATRYARLRGLRRVAFVLPSELMSEEENEVLAWVAEGCVGGAYGFDHLKGDKKKLRPKPSSCDLLIDKKDPKAPTRITAAMRQEVKQAEGRAEAVNWVRDLVNEPPNLLGPVELEQQAREMAGREGLRMTVLGDKAIKNRGMGLLASVAAGTRQGARLLHLRHLPEGPVRGRVALVGKGVTFDSGGLSLKPPSSQPDMKSDMAGAATVLGIMQAVAQENLPWEVHGIVPTCENMPGPGATRPGDVFQSMSGKTVEVRNTDAEGRLILADALTYAKELKPDLIVDFATLTGACVVALGSLTAGVFGNQPEWNERAKAAADEAGELIWPMPLEPGLKSELRSNVADLRNTGSRWGGAISAALFLEEFVDKTPWLHFDIAGPGFLDKTHGFHPKGGTGFGVLSLLNLLGRKGADQPS